jgi:hypothetical protein
MAHGGGYAECTQGANDGTGVHSFLKYLGE